MIATLERSRSRPIRSPRFVELGHRPAGVHAFGGGGGAVDRCPARSRAACPARRRCAPRRPRTAPHPHDLALDGEIARQGDRVIVDPHVDGRHAAAGLAHHRPVGAEVDQRGENAAVGEAALQVHHPFLAPVGVQLDAVVLDRDHLEAEPLVVRRAGDSAWTCSRVRIGSSLMASPRPCRSLRGPGSAASLRPPAPAAAPCRSPA